MARSSTSGGQRSHVRRWVVDAVIERAGWPVTMKALERLRDLANHGLGAGSASLSVSASGERQLLDRLAGRWAGREELIVVDVGAHRGEYAEAVQSVFGTPARIHCFEPDPASFRALVARVGAATECHQLALGATPGVARLFTDRTSSPLASLHPKTFDLSGIPATASDEVSVETLDRIVERLGVTTIDLLKVDVEGHELAVLQGATRLLEENAVAVVQFEFGERNLASRTYLRDFYELLGPRYDLFRLNPRGLSQLAYRPACEVFLLEANYVAVNRSRVTVEQS